MQPSTLPDQAVIRQAGDRIRDNVIQTPVWQSADLDQAAGHSLLLKCENLQRTGSFKARGALNWVRTATEQELKGGLVTVSAGNHAIALAWAAARTGTPLTVVMPEGSSEMKIRRTRDLGAEVKVHGSIQDAVALCHQRVEDQNLTLVHPYNDLRVMAGQGTVGLELLEQCPDMCRILCPVGGGGLISGLALAVKASRPEVEIIGIEPEGAATMGNAWRRNDPAASLESVDTWAASLAPAVVGEYTFAATRQVVDRMVTVSEPAIREATRLLLTEARLYVEPGAAVGLAALLEGSVEPAPERADLLVLTGGNLDLDQVRRCEGAQ
ncbi:threonine/serine dehydratase [Marinobacter lacisalsi]|uniref:Threonine/serine dehydratase n=1 Tax=Marinobacter lacisalsi TaxID=475979 RepID=A0ABV8QMJ1_9GAMM